MAKSQKLLGGNQLLQSLSFFLFLMTQCNHSSTGWGEGGGPQPAKKRDGETDLLLLLQPDGEKKRKEHTQARSV